ncbi:hypothetical protein EVAR_37481_1 [Eumeta japonica]|uniref:Uncharacterized protein n=1 Tax=Eumeta variegata TaxID=151549 RepID=A0A4C1XG80_EUMVA|nr:hypothetical protein EVAR_37481_1 [Eumeta japonica]
MLSDQAIPRLCSPAGEVGANDTKSGRIVYSVRGDSAAVSQEAVEVDFWRYTPEAAGQGASLDAVTSIHANFVR